MMKEKIAFISIDKIVNKVMADQLQKIFGFYYDIEKIILNSDEEIDVENCTIAICSNSSIVEEAKRKLSRDIPIIGAKRTINMQNVSELTGIESGTNVIVVSNNHAAAMETIEILANIGINHINMLPYYEGCGIEVTDIAITPGGIHTLPRGIKKTIDLGIKIISMSSIIEIFSMLDMPIKLIDVIIDKSNRDIINANHYNTEMNNYLHGIFEVIHDGVATFDEKGNITLCSKNFSNLLGREYIDVLSLNYREIFANSIIEDLITENNNLYDEITDFNNRRFVINKKEFYKNSKTRGFVLSLQDITMIQKLENKVRKKLMNKGFISKYSFDDVIGESEIIKSKVNIAKKMARSDFSVLIQGNNGTGKEIFAQAIHNNSKRKSDPFIAVNLASLSDDLIESELFGYEEGAFTGALKGGKKGLFEMAHNGTIFIDEIGDISQRIQQRLLRVLQEKEILKIGGKSIIPIDTRIIAASNVDLYQSVKENKFRIDLYYRLNILQFQLPDLKERLGDIELLAKYFFNSINSNKHINKDVLEVFHQYSWPGNIRELENLIYYFDSIVDNDEITVADLPEFFMRHINVHEETNYDEIKDYFSNKNMFDDCMNILKVMDSYKNKKILLGRKTIKSILEKNEIILSLEQIRHRTDKLSEIGMVNIGKTKQGSTITNKGILFISKYLNFK